MDDYDGKAQLLVNNAVTIPGFTRSVNVTERNSVNNPKVPTFSAVLTVHVHKASVGKASPLAAGRWGAAECVFELLGVDL